MPCAGCSGRHHKSQSFDPFIDLGTLIEKCRLDNGTKLFKNPMIGPNSKGWGACRLQALPNECYQACLQYLDIGTLTVMRRVSQFSRLAVSSIYQYREIYEHAPQALRACLSTGIASHIPLLGLHNALTTMECYYCQKEDPLNPSFGTYLSLFECRRACLFCLRNSPDLLPLDFPALVSLSLQRKSSIKPIHAIRSIAAIPGSYGPYSTPIANATSLVRAQSVTTSKALSEKEMRVLFERVEMRGPRIFHHPLVMDNDESDIKPSPDYVDPTSAKRVLMMYQTAVAFPYLSSSKQICDYGTMCADCILHMEWEENRWINEKIQRIRQGMSPSAPDSVRDFINDVRRKGCATYSVSEDAKIDADVITNRARGQRIASGIDDEFNLPESKGQDQSLQKKEEQSKKGIQSLSIQEHRLFHAQEVLSKKEREFRERQKKKKAAQKS
ncbi:hypothetical protein B0O99DRAFT_692294 [Bisporella sp. PMI_857]|nr:hypothetical protein B0O99DRAFT_692294 [Bisporella sp. PMI_857]